MMLDAGNDTTQTTLSNCIYHLARYQRAQRKLREILLSHLRSPGLCEDEAIVPSYEELKHISYLRAVLDENFRCRPPLARGLPRRVMAPMMKIVAGGVAWDIRQGTTVSVPLWVIHHDANLFGEPNESIPERWMDNHDPQKGLGVYYTSDAEIKNLRDFFVLFSIGPRACIGRNLAYIEVSIVVAALALVFEGHLAGDMELQTVERFNCNVKELFVRLRPLSNSAMGNLDSQHLSG